ncbi:MAG: hypothetical protein JWN21_2239 [Sphingomonas bacterium]|nr:hypothetical protein [Sphingomonas bacterium]
MRLGNGAANCMGDLSAEPSMEEILSSIKRIIAEEGDGTPSRARRPARPLPTAISLARSPDDDEADDDEILELSVPMPAARPDPAPRPGDAAATPAAETMVSQAAAAASRGALDSLSRLMVKPEPGSDGSLEGLVREMLRPMLSEWLDAHLPELVETMVAREIKRITGQPG